jgi:hypothetical protein
MNKRSRQRRPSWLPKDLTALVCSWLPVQETLQFLTQVLRRPDTRVAWPHADLEKAVSCRTLSRVGLLAGLREVQATVSRDTVEALTAVTRQASNLQTLQLSLHGSEALLVELLATTPSLTSLDVRVMGVVLDEACFSDALPLLCSLRHLRLDYENDNINVSSEFVSTKVRCAGPLESLSLTGDIATSTALLTVIVQHQPKLKELSLDLYDMEEGEVLASLDGLRKCRFQAKSLAVVKFVEKMHGLTSVSLTFEHHDVEDEGVFVVPPNVRDFKVEVEFPPPIKFVFRGPDVLFSLGACASSVVSALSCSDCSCALVELETGVTQKVAQLFRLLARLPRLHRLHLYLVRPKAYAELEALEQMACPFLTVRELVLRFFGIGVPSNLSWLSGFPAVSTLTLCDWRLGRQELGLDEMWRQTFRLCPALRSLVDSDLGVVVTVDRRPDGTLVKRSGENMWLM